MVRKLVKFIFALSVIFLLNEIVLEAKETPQFYHVIYQEPNGNNEYYRTAPEVTIKHFDGKLVTRYQILFPSGRKLTGQISTAGKEDVISATAFEDGEHQLDVWMEEKSGKVIAGTEQTKKIKIDRTGPDREVQFTIDRKKENVVEIEAEDTVSGVEGIYYKLGDGEVQYLKGTHVYVNIPKEFQGIITAYAVDKAGNIGTPWESAKIDDSHIKSTVRESIKSQAAVDQTKPRVMLEGIDNYMITGQNVQFSCEVTDDNEIITLKGKIVWEDVKGSKKTMEVTDWSKEGETYMFQSELKEDGIYRISFQVIDAAGNQSELERQVIIDKSKPVILKVQELDGAEVDSFQWDYNMDEIVSDFSTYRYEVRLDGVLCNAKKIYSKAGKHTLEVVVTDAAGNQAKVVAEFRVIAEEQRLPIFMWKWFLVIFFLILAGIASCFFCHREEKNP